MAERARRGQPRWGRRRTVIGATVVVVALLASGAGAWAAESGGAGGYRMAKVVRATVSKSLTVVGTVQPVSDASAAFQVGGKVATVTATVGQNVTAGQSLATLSTTALSETVSSAQSTLSAAEAKLTEDENSQSGTSGSTTTTTAPTHGNANTTGNTNGSDTATITQDQNTLTADETTTNADQQQEAADLAQATSACGASPGGGGTTTTTTSTSTTTTTTPTSSSTSACTTALQKVSDDQQQISVDEATVAKDESALAKALGDTSSPSSPTSTGGAPSNTGTGGLGSHALAAAGNGTPSSNGSSPSGTSSPGGNGSSAASDTPQQIAEDQASIDTARANLIEAQQALSGGQLTSPINGTIVSIGMAVGDTVSAGSSTAVIVIIGTHSFEVSATLTSSQVASVKVGDTARVSVDGLTTTTDGTISQLGPVQSTSSGYTYPVVISLPSSVQGLFSGSSANVTIATGQVTDVVAVPTSAVITQGSRSYVEMLENGVLTRKTVHLAMVGGVFTEVLSGLSVGQSVVLADLSLAVPSSNTASLGGGGGTGLFGGGGGGRFRQFVGVAPGAGGGGGVVPGQSVTIGG